LRKIEREPAEAPLMSSAVRALERARRNRAKSLLENSRDALREIEFKKVEIELERRSQKELPETSEPKPFVSIVSETVQKEVEQQAQKQISDEKKAEAQNGGAPKKEKRKREKSNEDVFGNRKSISEVLHDIYDSK